MSGGNQTRVVLLRLYARILRLHREKLPLPLRDLGDQYVREEFRNMWKLKEADLGKHHKEFSKQWEDYTRSLSLTDSQDPEGTTERKKKITFNNSQPLSPLFLSLSLCLSLFLFVFLIRPPTSFDERHFVFNG